MAHLILHIGQHKTGTSALQRALRSAVDDLAEQGISYPLFLKAKNHARVPLMFAEAVRSTADPSGPLPRTPSIDQLAADLGHRVTGDSRWIMSSEEFSGSLDQVNGRHCVEFFRQYFARIDTILYLRRQDHLLTGIYSELIKNEPYFDLTACLVERRPAMFGQMAMIDTWESLLAQDELTVRPYLERFRRVPGALFADFGRAARLRLPAPKTGNARGLKNPGLDAETIAVLRTIADEQEDIVAVGGSEQTRKLRKSPVGRAMRPFFATDSDGASRRRFVRPEFVRAVAMSTDGPKYTPDADTIATVSARYAEHNEMLVGRLVELAGESHFAAARVSRRGQDWSEWLRQAPPEPMARPSVSATRLGEVLEELARWQPPVAGGVRGSPPDSNAGSRRPVRAVMRKARRSARQLVDNAVPGRWSDRS